MFLTSALGIRLCEVYLSLLTIDSSVCSVVSVVLDGDVAVDLSNLLVWWNELEEFADEKADDLSRWITESEVLVGIADADVLVVADVVAKTLYLRAK